MILQKVPIGGHPSMAAASSYDREMLEKNAKRKIVVYGTLMPTYRKIIRSLTVMSCFNSCNCDTRPNRGSMIITTGMPIAATKPLWMVRFRKNLNRDST